MVSYAEETPGQIVSFQRLNIHIALQIYFNVHMGLKRSDGPGTIVCKELKKKVKWHRAW